MTNLLPRSDAFPSRGGRSAALMRALAQMHPPPQQLVEPPPPPAPRSSHGIVPRPLADCRPLLNAAKRLHDLAARQHAIRLPEIDLLDVGRRAPPDPQCAPDISEGDALLPVAALGQQAGDVVGGRRLARAP